MGWGWGRGWRGRGWVGPWPGRGPFSYLPPWQRPGWLFGRGACWWLFGWPWGYRWMTPWTPYMPFYAPPYYYYYPYPYYPYPYYPFYRPW